MLMQELGGMIKEDPNLCGMSMVEKRKYIISKWIKLLCTVCFNAAR